MVWKLIRSKQLVSLLTRSLQAAELFEVEVLAGLTGDAEQRASWQQFIQLVLAQDWNKETSEQVSARRKG